MAILHPKLVWSRGHGSSRNVTAFKIIVCDIVSSLEMVTDETGSWWQFANAHLRLMFNFKPKLIKGFGICCRIGFGPHHHKVFSAISASNKTGDSAKAARAGKGSHSTDACFVAILLNVSHVNFYHIMWQRIPYFDSQFLYWEHSPISLSTILDPHFVQPTHSKRYIKLNST